MPAPMQIKPHRLFHGLLIVSGATAVGVFGFAWWRKGFDAPGFYVLLTFLGTLLLVYTTARYMFVFEEDAVSRQRVLERWEVRRFYAGRMFAIADGFMNLYFANKRELRQLIFEWEHALLDRKAMVESFNFAGESRDPSPDELAQLDGWTNNRVQASLQRFNERAKEISWQAEALLHQARMLLEPSQLDEARKMLAELSEEFSGLEAAKARYKRTEELVPTFLGLVDAIHTSADRKLRLES
jgi:hypothetical protein